MEDFAYPSFRSIYLEVLQDGFQPAPATGFLVQTRRGPMLLTNRHVVSGTDVFTRKVSRMPTSLRILHNKANCLGEWIAFEEPLYEAGQQRWIEHPVLGETADFVALPLTHTEGVEILAHDPGQRFYAEDPSEAHRDFLLGPGDPVSIIGFPFGKSSTGYLPIWVTGFLASEPTTEYLGLPVQLIDSRTRPGQSGSPVFAYRAGGGVHTSRGTMTIFNAPVGKFIGIYSGRISAESDIGLVWKASAIQELLAAV